LPNHCHEISSNLAAQKREEKFREKTAQKWTPQQAAEVCEVLESNKDPYKNKARLYKMYRTVCPNIYATLFTGVTHFGAPHWLFDKMRSSTNTCAVDESNCLGLFQDQAQDHPFRE